MRGDGFDADRKGSGTMEWAEVTENICRGCPNNCLYCYAANNADRFGQRDRKDWSREEFTKRAEMKSYPARDGVVMFPSSHDITPFNVDACVRVMRLILKAGNRLLVVSKPRLACVGKVIEGIKPWREQILFRFTIGSTNESCCAFWEPGAPAPVERIASLFAAHRCGFRTSVSIEPMLEGTAGAVDVVRTVKPFVTDTIWIGKMNKVRTRVSPRHATAARRIAEWQSDDSILELHSILRGDPTIRWKESIKEVLAKHRVTTTTD